MPSTFYIEDNLHAEYHGDTYPTFEAALAEVQKLAQIPWDEDPNRAPCTSWKTCGRDWCIVENSGDGNPGYTRVVEITSAGVKWAAGFGAKG
jgi:hypothetical protein